MGQRIFRVTAQLMQDILRLPADCRVVDLSAHIFFDTGDWAVKVESPVFSDVKPGCCIPTVMPVYRSEFVDGRMAVEFVGWDGFNTAPAARFRPTSDDPLGWITEPGGAVPMLGGSVEIAAAPAGKEDWRMVKADAGSFASPDMPTVKFREFL